MGTDAARVAMSQIRIARPPGFSRPEKSLQFSPNGGQIAIFPNLFYDIRSSENPHGPGRGHMIAINRRS